MLYGQGWECSETGAQVWQRLTLSATAPAELAGEEQTIARAVRLLRRRRLEVQFGTEQLQGRLSSLRANPLMRLAARKTYAELQAQLALHQQMVKELPQAPEIHRLDPDADSGLPSNAMKVGASVWYVNRKTQQLFSCEITGVAIEKLDGSTLVYETLGAVQDGKPIRRTCAHRMDGLKTLGAPETAFMDPLTARDYLKMIAPTPAPEEAPAAAVPAAQVIPIKAVVAAAAPQAEPPPSEPQAAAPDLSDPDLHSIATAPFDESLLR